jgi:glycosyltransferase involved in cell wall biosynthesis
VRRRRVLIVTYTLANPAAVGVFFRALRLGFELDRRGHEVVVANAGPVPQDPKVDAARGRIELREIPWGGPELPLRKARKILAGLRPDLVVFGEGPFDTMRTAFRAACGLRVPFILLDQYYQDWLTTKRRDIDRILLYGLTPFVYDGEFQLGDRHRLIPPFIGEVTAKGALPAPPELADEPWVTVLGFEPLVLARGIELVAGLPEPRPVRVALSHDPGEALRLAAEAGLDPRRVVAPGLAGDADLFGFMAAARVVVLANGYMQILESLALGRPAICVMRGVGLEGWTVEDRFKAYVSIDEGFETQRERLVSWLAAPPIPADLAGRLAGERHGARRVADEAEALLARAWHPADLRLRLRRVARSYLGTGKP